MSFFIPDMNINMKRCIMCKQVNWGVIPLQYASPGMPQVCRRVINAVWPPPLCNWRARAANPRSWWTSRRVVEHVAHSACESPSFHFPYHLCHGKILNIFNVEDSDWGDMDIFFLKWAFCHIKSFLVGGIGEDRLISGDILNQGGISGFVLQI